MKRILLIVIAFVFVFNMQAQDKSITTKNAKGIFGNALDFDGADDWIDCTNNGGDKASYEALGLPTSEITLEAWVCPREYYEWTSIVSFFQDNGDEEYGWDLETGYEGTFGFSIAANGSGLTYLYTTNTFNQNEWYHVVGTYDGTTMKLYVNGNLEATSIEQSGNISYLDSWLAIGMYKDDNEDGAYNGGIDEVRIWDYAKTETEIIDNMNNELNGDETGLVAYFNFNQGVAGGNNTTITTLPDESGNSLDGVLNNFELTGDVSNWVDNIYYVSISELITENVSIYPNPAQDYINLNIIDEVIENILIYDEKGKNVIELNENTKTVDISNLATGVYILNIKTVKQDYSSTIIKK